MANRVKASAPEWGKPVFRVGLVNNMSEAAFEETHREFTRLVHAGAGAHEVELRYYRIPTVARRPVVAGPVAHVYQDLEDLYRCPPDTLVVTGTEPLKNELTDEQYWEDLAGLLHWAEVTVPSSLLSCLSAHGALRALDHADRVPLSVKRSGVFPQAVNQAHPLGHGLGAVAAFPHSRWNTVPGEVVRSLGYDVVVGTTGEEWTVAARERAGRLLVLVQGHPEYEPTMLLREYRRDVRRWAGGSMSAPPHFPGRYVDREGEQMLRAWSASAESLTRAEWSRAFPFDAIANHVVPCWTDAAVRLFGNWLEDASSRARPLILGRARA